MVAAYPNTRQKQGRTLRAQPPSASGSSACLYGKRDPRGMGVGGGGGNRIQKYRGQALRLSETLPGPDPQSCYQRGEFNWLGQPGRPPRPPVLSGWLASQPRKLARPASRGITARQHIPPPPGKQLGGGREARAAPRGCPPPAPPGVPGQREGDGYQAGAGTAARGQAARPAGTRGETPLLPANARSSSRGCGSGRRTERADGQTDRAAGGSRRRWAPTTVRAPCPAAAERRSRQRSRLHLPAVPPPPPPPGPARPCPGLPAPPAGAPLPAPPRPPRRRPLSPASSFARKLSGCPRPEPPRAAWSNSSLP
ncbi:basic proline-rich protein-like [Pseudopipra pipra]|uniref:basic proline-rich protein-like n=1 Tax=Pseudopipra pipra TaxID=415032 RepID=UPI003139D161